MTLNCVVCNKETDNSFILKDMLSTGKLEKIDFKFCLCSLHINLILDILFQISKTPKLLKSAIYVSILQQKYGDQFKFISTKDLKSLDEKERE